MTFKYIVKNLFDKNILYVLDTETTGLNGYPNEKVLEITIAKLVLDTLESTIVYDTLIKHEITDHIRKCFIVTNGYITTEEIEKLGKNETDVANTVKNILNNNNWTSFNTAFDYNKFLKHPPYNLSKPVNCVMMLTKSIVLARNRGGYIKYPNLDEAYRHFYHKSFSFDESKKHRSLYDTLMTVEVIKALHTKK